MTSHRSRSSQPILSRRGFLHHLGAIGGSSLVMTAMSSWDLMAGSAGQRPGLSGRPKARVLVLGAGLSGLVVGYELGKLGYDYQVLAGPLSNTRVRLREVKADLIGQVNELLVKALDQKQLDLPLTVDDQKRLTSFPVSAGWQALTSIHERAMRG